MKLNLEQLAKVHGGLPPFCRTRPTVILTPVPGAPGFFAGQRGKLWFVRTPSRTIEFFENKDDIKKFILIFQLGKLLKDAHIDEDSLDYYSYVSSSESSFTMSTESAES